MQAWYCTREAVLASFEVAESTRIAPLVDREILASSERVDHQLHRKFTVEFITLKFDWPNNSYAPVWRLYLNERSILSVQRIVSGGVELNPADYFLYRADGEQEPPFDYIEINRDSSAAFTSGTSPQRAIEIEALAGYVATTSVTGSLSTTINDTTDTLIVEPTNNRGGTGTGSALIIGDERMHVLERGYVDSGTVLLKDLESRNADSTIELADTSAITMYDFIVIDGEYMLVQAIVGSNLIVRRALNGSVLAPHSAGYPIYVPNSYRVIRGAYGTTAASHTAGATVNVQRYPAQIEQLALAESVVSVAQNAGLYARVVGQGGSTREAVGKGLDDMRRSAYE